MADLTGMMQAAAGAAGEESLFIEDVFSCFLYTGTGAAQTITNGIDLDGEGGLVWLKQRDDDNQHFLYDTLRGVLEDLNTNSTQAQETESNSLTAFNSDGFSLGSFAPTNGTSSAGLYVSWTFRKAPKFFDVVTYTGTGANRTVAHNLGSVPGSIWVKRTNTTGNWQVYHRANTAAPETDFLVLNSTAATADSNTRWNDTLPTDTVFTVGTEATVNASGGTYVAYLFAHDDGGFGDDGTENAITCGSYVGDGTENFSKNITLGFEPQWIFIKRASTTGNWFLIDTMRGMPVNQNNSAYIFADSNAAEQTLATPLATPTATGFNVSGSNINNNGATVIFIAIRRGPMKTPTAGTEVFAPVTYSGDQAAERIIAPGFSTDLALFHKRNTASDAKNIITSRLSGINFMATNLTDAQQVNSGRISNWSVQNGVVIGSDGEINSIGNTFISWMFRRAPGYFDVVCYTGTGSATTFAHNLGVVPELMIMKKRSAIDDWAVYAGDNTDFLQLNTTAATADDNTYWNDTSPTSSVFSVGTNADVNTSAATYVAYLFASLAGVQDIGTYTGNGTSVTITTGFQPRFIVVKRTNSTGAWIVGDSARGLVAGDDPFLFLNALNAETTNQDWVDVSATGFAINQTAENACVSAGVYLYWAIS